MIINLATLVKLPVYTESGIKLGKIFDLELDIENQMILRYLVRPNFISMQRFLIQAAQIKEITKEKIIVDDAVSAAETNQSIASGE
jgi:sporulation protein YlmC with PRC-barrel domain